MNNPLFNQFNQPNNEISAFVNQVKQFKNTFNGNPQQEVEKLLKSGQMTQQQFNQFAQVANQLMPFFKN